jgi:hypothetical protein
VVIFEQVIRQREISPKALLFDASLLVLARAGWYLC